MSELMMSPNPDRQAINVLAKQLTQGKKINKKIQRIYFQGLENIIQATRSLASAGLDPDNLMFDGVKALAETIHNLLEITSDKTSTSPGLAQSRLLAATAATAAALAK